MFQGGVGWEGRSTMISTDWPSLWSQNLSLHPSHPGKQIPTDICITSQELWDTCNSLIYPTLPLTHLSFSLSPLFPFTCWSSHLCQKLLNKASFAICFPQISHRCTNRLLKRPRLRPVLKRMTFSDIWKLWWNKVFIYTLLLKSLVFMVISCSEPKADVTWFDCPRGSHTFTLWYPIIIPLLRAYSWDRGCLDITTLSSTFSKINLPENLTFPS